MKQQVLLTNSEFCDSPLDDSKNSAANDQVNSQFPFLQSNTTSKIDNSLTEANKQLTSNNQKQNFKNFFSSLFLIRKKIFAANSGDYVNSNFESKFCTLNSTAAVTATGGVPIEFISKELKTPQSSISTDTQNESSVLFFNSINEPSGKK